MPSQFAEADRALLFESWLGDLIAAGQGDQNEARRRVNEIAAHADSGALDGLLEAQRQRLVELRVSQQRDIDSQKIRLAAEQAKYEGMTP